MGNYSIQRLGSWLRHQEKELKGTIGEKGVKQSCFQMTCSTKESEGATKTKTKNLLDLIHTFDKGVGYELT